MTAFVTAYEVAQYARISGGVTEGLESIVEAACDVVVDACGPILVTEFVEDVPHVGGKGALTHTPVIAASSPAGLTVSHGSGVVRGLAGADPTVTYTAGYEVPPAWAVEAVKIIAAHMWRARLGPSRDNPDSGAGYLVPNRAAILMEPHRKLGGFA